MSEGRTLATDAVRRSIEAIDETEPQLNAYVAVHRQKAREQAQLIDARTAVAPAGSPLSGVPIAVKDNFDEAGVVCTAGSRAYADRVPLRDAGAIGKLRRAGAVVVGRTNMHELADGVTSENPYYGPVHNPWNTDCHPGGSSGGSAAAVASGTVLAALGTDTGGSVRIPASLCGVAGFKPTRGTVPTDGIVPLSTTLDHVGPIGASVADCAAVWRVLVGADSPVPHTLPRRIGVLDGFGADADAGVGACFSVAVGLLESIGCRAVPVTVPGLAQGIRMLVQIYGPEFTRTHADTLARRPQELGDEVREDLERGLRADPSRRASALQQMLELTHASAAAMKDLDALVCPTTPHPARPIGSPNPFTFMTFTCPFNLTGQPAVSVPMGLVDGLPVGLQIVGRLGCDADVLGLAAAFERKLGFERTPPVRA